MNDEQRDNLSKSMKAAWARRKQAMQEQAARSKESDGCESPDRASLFDYSKTYMTDDMEHLVIEEPWANKDDTVTITTYWYKLQRTNTQVLK